MANLVIKQKMMQSGGGSLIHDILFSNETLRNSVELVNHLDIQLYDFALKVFIRRLEDYNIQWNH